MDNSSKLTYLDGKGLYYSFLAGTRSLLEGQGEINKINVFPVPDADTGSNMASTLRTIIETITPVSSYKQTADAIAAAALIGARGNSGVIFAQFLFGLSNETRNVERISLQAFAESVKRSVQYMYEAVANPVEGTMLSVIRDWADYIYNNHSYFDDFKKMMAASMEVARESLVATAQRMRQLTHVNVVDAGAKGFVLFLEGILEFIKTGNLRALRSLLENDPVVLPADSDDHGSLTYRYCTEALIRGESLDKNKLREIVRGFGDSMVIAGSSKTLRLHIHTDDPQKLFEELRSFGTLAFQKADDMQKQYEIAHHRKWNIALVADSSCDLPQELIDFYQIHLVPINLFFGENHYLDKVTIHPEQFYRMLDLEEDFPTSAQPNDKAFENLYSHLASHYDSIIAVHVVGKLSGTLRSSLMAAERISRETGKKISVFDSRNVSGGLGLVVLKIARAIEEGKNHDEIAARVPEWVDKTRLLVSVRTLKYLVRGGRVSKMKGFLANLLHMHPIISFNKEGNTYMLEKTFTMKSNMQRVTQLVGEELSGKELDEYMILHAHCETDARWMADQMVEVTGRDPLAVLDISPVIGVHAGPGSLAVAFMVK